MGSPTWEISTHSVCWGQWLAWAQFIKVKLFADESGHDTGTQAAHCCGGVERTSSDTEKATGLPVKGKPEELTMPSGLPELSQSLRLKQEELQIIQAPGKETWLVHLSY